MTVGELTGFVLGDDGATAMLAFRTPYGPIHGFAVFDGVPEQGADPFGEGRSRIMSRHEARRAFDIVREKLPEHVRAEHRRELAGFEANLNGGYNPPPENLGPPVRAPACLAHDAAMG
ncbi:MAG: hypothetical protein EOM26_04850 [Alphaproteobacteria bacterium]|nr:hypothetical protein [Alphaproteobacteria bacterium]